MQHDRGRLVTGQMPSGLEKEHMAGKVRPGFIRAEPYHIMAKAVQVELSTPDATVP
jgi:hypothetical protein